MQVKYLHGHRDYQINKLRISPNHPVALMRWDALSRFEKALSKGLSSSDAARVVGIPRATLYRWKSRRTKSLEALIPQSRRPKRFRTGRESSRLKTQIIDLRKEFPTWGKRKITVLLARQGVKTSQSAVGRSISELIKRNQLASAKTAAQYAGWKRNLARPYAFKLKRGQKLIGTSPGEVIQVDHMTVTTPSGPIIKHFNGVCTYSRWNVADVFRTASATTASIFMDKLVSNSPFPIKQIQVDGGSEFMAEFEDACRNRGIKLAVLAPKSPELNGHVERINGTWRSDFYNQYELPVDLQQLRAMVDDYTDTYNWDRPHDNLGLQTPQEFLQARGIQIRASQSHML